MWTTFTVDLFNQPMAQSSPDESATHSGDAVHSYRARAAVLEQEVGGLRFKNTQLRWQLGEARRQYEKRLAHLAQAQQLLAAQETNDAATKAANNIGQNMQGNSGNSLATSSSAALPVADLMHGSAAGSVGLTASNRSSPSASSLAAAMAAAAARGPEALATLTRLQEHVTRCQSGLEQQQLVVLRAGGQGAPVDASTRQEVRGCCWFG